MKKKYKIIIPMECILLIAFIVTTAIIIQNGIFSAKNTFVKEIADSFDHKKLLTELTDIDDTEVFVRDLSERLKTIPYDKTIMLINEEGITAIAPTDKKSNKNTYEEKKQKLKEIAQQTYFDGDFDTPQWFKSNARNKEIQFEFLFSLNEQPNILLIDFHLNPISAALANDNYHFLLTETTVFFLIIQLAALLFCYEYLNNKEKLEKRQYCFLNGIAHELKTPLTEITSLIECISVTSDETKKQLFIRKVDESVDNMSKTVDLFLQNSAVQSKKPKKEPVSLNIEAKRKSDEYASGFDAKGISFNCNFEEPATVSGDRQMLSIVIDNFLSNALRYTAEGGTVEAKTFQKRKRVGFSVYNETNVPIDAKKIWESPFEVDEETGRIHGIGLNLCKKILRIHGFRYGCKKGAGGVTFYFETKQTKQERRQET